MTPVSRFVRSLAVLLGAAVVMSACGSSDDTADAPASTIEDATVEDGTVEIDDSSTVADGDDPAATTPTSVAATEKPEVQIPDETPTELVITDLVAGSGPPAQVGDTVVVNYVGVRSEDGFEFDNSYDRGQPYPVTLGTGSVIPGWDQGLVGAQAGMRRQLDIPASLAYGDAGSGDIRPGDALTFVIDVVAVEPRPVITAPPQADPSECPATDGSEPTQREFSDVQPFCIDVTRTYTAEVDTNFGSFTIELLPEQAPQTVNNFVVLARYGYFDGTVCHRVITDFVVQCGDPEGTGFGGPGYSIPDELPLPGQYEIGSIAMANAGPNTGGSQFFIISGPNGATLPPQYSLFGQVVEGFEPVITDLNALADPTTANGTPPLETITIESVTITET
jgi:cyclophilin family peptidyl-prolyl cis-trans isomerase/FKBP-type peptidyl-prolyl cis-trans isomerase